MGSLEVSSSARASRSRTARLLPLLLLFLSLHACVLAGPTRQYGWYDGPVNKAAEEAAARLAPQMETKGSLGRQGCRGVLDICCYLSSSRITSPSYDRYSGQTTFGSLDTIEEPSARFGQTMKFLHPLVSLAASPFCPPAPSASSTPSLPSSCDNADRQGWDGFAGLRHVFSFGDSYTTTEFRWQELPYPSAEAGVPLGNPAYPGVTSANGANWIDYLTVRYNHTLLTTYNLAVGGATAGRVGPDVPTIKSLRGQVHDWFMPAYALRDGGREPGGAPGAPLWRGHDSVFTFWLGINDIGGTYMHGPDGPDGTDAVNRAIVLGEYAALAADLRTAGARNFVFVNVPPIDRSPLTRGAGEAAQRLEKADVEDFNSLVVEMARRLRAQGAGAQDGGEAVNVWVYDSHAAFGKVMDDPSSFPQTVGYKNVTDCCEAYQL